jgi:hypothetical protein
MSLHAEVPLVTLLHLVHLGVTLALLVLGRTERMDNGCIHNGSGRDPHIALGQILIDHVQHGTPEVVLLQQILFEACDTSTKTARFMPLSTPIRAIGTCVIFPFSGKWRDQSCRFRLSLQSYERVGHPGYYQVYPERYGISSEWTSTLRTITTAIPTETIHNPRS